MSIVIPIISSFNADGVDKATKKFKDLEGAGPKASHAIRKAALPAAAALGVMAVAAVGMAKAAAADDAASKQLARTLDKVTGATDASIEAIEEWITMTSIATAVADDELRPALAKLATGTGDLTKAQEGLGIALDISAATGKPLEAVATALSKAYAGNLKGLNALDPRMKQLIKNGMSAEQAIGVLARTFKGDAAAAAETAEGRFKGLGIALAETQEAIGAALLPAIEAVLPVLQAIAGWAQRNSTVFVVLAGAVAGLAVAISIANVALKVMTVLAIANPIGLIALAIAAQIALIVVLWKKSELFRDVVTGAWEAIRAVVVGVVSYFIDIVKPTFDVIAGVIGTISGLLTGDFSGAWEGIKKTVGGVFDWLKATVLRLPIIVGGLALDAGKALGTALLDGLMAALKGLGKALKFLVLAPIRFIAGAIVDHWPDLPGLPGPPDFLKGLKTVGLATGGIVTRPTLALIGEAGPEAVVPLNGRNAPGGISITVHAGLVSTPDQIGQQIIEAIQSAQRRSGPVFASA